MIVKPDRSVDRAAAKRFNRGVSSGPKYVFLKILIRTFRKTIKLFHKETEFKVINPAAGRVLVSHLATMNPRSRPNTLLASGSATFISHDVIPWSDPFVVSEAHAAQFTKQLTVLLKSGAYPIANSETSKAELGRFCRETGIVAKPAEVFPMPSILYEYAAKCQGTSRIEATEPFVIYCSTIEARKNHLILARVWQRAIDEGVSLPRLVCVGKWGFGVDTLKNFISSHPSLSTRIEFTGQIDDSELIDLYRSAIFGVFPSRNEGWGFGAVECLDFGIPVIISTAASLKEATKNIMPSVDPDDEDGWYKQILTLTESITARQSLNKKIVAQHRVISAKESWEAIKALGLRFD